VFVFCVGSVCWECIDSRWGLFGARGRQSRKVVVNPAKGRWKCAFSGGVAADFDEQILVPDVGRILQRRILSLFDGFLPRLMNMYVPEV
jgi:hypothetical protein